MHERWRPIRGFPGYEVSDHGRVKSLARDYHYGSHEDMILSQRDRRGYKSVTLFRDGERHYKSVHRLVADAFIPNPDKLPIVNHKDETRTNNRADNLEWCTSKYNTNYGGCRDKIGKGVSRKVIQLTKDGSIVAMWDSMTKAAESTGACLSEISKCCKNSQFTAGGYKWRRFYE